MIARECPKTMPKVKCYVASRVPLGRLLRPHNHKDATKTFGNFHSNGRNLICTSTKEYCFNYFGKIFVCCPLNGLMMNSNARFNLNVLCSMFFFFYCGLCIVVDKEELKAFARWMASYDNDFCFSFFHVYTVRIDDGRLYELPFRLGFVCGCGSRASRWNCLTLQIDVDGIQC